MLLSFVFSFKNEESNLSELIRRVRAAISSAGLDYEMIFVNDSSTDGSMAILKAERMNDSRIKFITMSRCFGYTPCVLAGLKKAKGDAVIYMDCDLQDPPELIPKLIEKWLAGAAVVHTTRTKRHGESPAKMSLTRLAYRIINMFSTISIPENTGDFKLLSRRAANEVLNLQEEDPFMRGLSLWVGFKQEFVFYEREARHAGTTHFRLFGSLAPAKEFVRGITSFSAAPLYFALFMGMAVSFFAFSYLVYIVISRVFYGMHLPGWPAMMVTMLFLGGTILFTVGVLGIYIGKIYDAVKKRPRYIIESEEGF